MLIKANQAGKVPVKLSVTRKGKTFLQTFWIKKNVAGILNTLAGFFGTSRSKAKDIPKDEFQKHNIAETHGMSYEQWEASFTEYFKNKAKWDTKFSGQAKTITDQKTGKTYSIAEKKSETKVEAKPKEKKQIDEYAMKLLYSLYGKKKQTPVSEVKEEIKPVQDIQKELASRKTFYKYNKSTDSGIPEYNEIKGEYHNIDGFHTFVHKTNTGWAIVDVNSGFTLDSNYRGTKKSVIQNMKDKIETHGKDRVLGLIHNRILEGEVSPLNTITEESDPAFAAKVEKIEQERLAKEAAEQKEKQEQEKAKNKLTAQLKKNPTYLKQKSNIKEKINIKPDKAGGLSETEFLDKYQNQSVLGIDDLDNLPDDWRKKSGSVINVLNVPKGKSTNEDPTILELTKSHASHEENRYIYNGVYHGDKGYVSTDGRRLLFIPDNKIKSSDIGKTYPIARYTEAQVDKIVSKDNPDREVIMHDRAHRELDGKFPDYERVIPQSMDGTPRKFNAEELYKKLDNLIAAGRFLNRNSNYPDYADKEWGKQPSFQTKITVQDTEGNPYDIGINAAYLQDAIKTQMQLGHKEIYLHHTGDAYGGRTKPIVISNTPDFNKVRDSKAPFSLIMPIKL